MNSVDPVGSSARGTRNWRGIAGLRPEVHDARAVAAELELAAHHEEVDVLHVEADAARFALPVDDLAFVLDRLVLADARERDAVVLGRQDALVDTDDLLLGRADDA